MVAPRRRRRRRNPAVPRSTLRVGGNPVVTTVTARPAVVRRWVHTTLWRHRRQHRYSGDGLTVGLGVQWTPPFRKLDPGAEPRPGTLQLCAGNRCLVFKIARAGGAGAPPAILRRFMADGRVTFAAYNVKSDSRKLRAHHGLEVASTLELRSAAAGDGLGSAPMAEMADRLLGIPRGRVEKPPWVATSEWDAEMLSWGQVRYAAADAYLSCRLGERLRRRRAPGVHAVHVEREDEYESASDHDEYESASDHDEYESASDDDDDGGDGGGGGGRWTDRFVGFIQAGWVQDGDDRDGYENDTYLPYQTASIY